VNTITDQAKRGVYEAGEVVVYRDGTKYTRVGGSVRRNAYKCGYCGEPGHTAPTCEQAQEGRS
jgi:hypothetical protein